MKFITFSAIALACSLFVSLPCGAQDSGEKSVKAIEGLAISPDAVATFFRTNNPKHLVIWQTHDPEISGSPSDPQILIKFRIFNDTGHLFQIGDPHDNLQGAFAHVAIYFKQGNEPEGTAIGATVESISETLETGTFSEEFTVISDVATQQIVDGDQFLIVVQLYQKNENNDCFRHATVTSVIVADTIGGNLGYREYHGIYDPETTPHPEISCPL